MGLEGPDELCWLDALERNGAVPPDIEEQISPRVPEAGGNHAKGAVSLCKAS